MSNLTPTPIIDKNGKQTTVHKKIDDGVNTSRMPGVPLDANKAEAYAKVEKIIIDHYPSIGKDDENRLKGVVELIISQPPQMTISESFEATKVKANRLGYSSAPWESVVTKAKEGWSEYEPTEKVNYLELDEGDKNLPWADRYKVMMAKMVAQHGKPMMDGDSPYGWVDSRFSKHLTSGGGDCAIAEVTSLVEDEWSQFLDTEAGNSDHEGAQCEAQCSCGWFRGRIRAEGTLGDMIQRLQGGVTPYDVFDETIR